jgi:twitching motility protein PilU
MELTINNLLKELIDRQGSDLYCVVGSPPMIRIHGIGEPVGENKLSPQDTEKLAMEILNDQQKKDILTDPEINLAYGMPGVGRFRGNIYKQRGTFAMVYRRVEVIVPTIEQLALPSVLGELVLGDRGLILITGATGSGKSTTLAAMIQHRNVNRAGHIVTIEDPIEFLHRNDKSILSQREVGSDTISFAKALRSALRQAPEVILIGEMRDQETVSAAIDFAETGHLVLSTLHSNNANQTMERIMQFFPPIDHARIYSSIANNLTAIISQRLVRKADGTGRVAAIEIMINTPRISDLIRRGEILQLKQTIASGTQEKMHTFDQHLYTFYIEKLITLEDALAAADSPNDLKMRIKGMVAKSI